MKKTFRLACTSVLLALLSMSAQAERADSGKPVLLEADRMSIDDLNKVQVLEGNVILTQGTLQIVTDRLVVIQDADGFQKGTAFGGAGGLARFKQKREGKDDYMEGEAEQIDYDARADKSELFRRAWVKSGLDEVRGAYISYDALNEKYLVTTGSGATKSATGASQARVRAIIQPRGKNANPEAQNGAPLTLRPAPAGK
ncbi:MAG: lipopolysaccharide transport periplasmic protein LptA [Candidatus Accumulibacter phosphatis]|jgi:lipopolysaccharide export system protein LptA|uniref:lipopolysaccharide transport periplasmic protein LptA n=1 Tax=Candidatus Accumulibacter sp. ACC012 TaxID=2823332 RepID=UPI0025BB5662|nr:lipopolysaccharide transport periplasmic protein LptA [Candidatus Accumulibacter sp. ACC012]